jgi:Xaa-Pro aminopeptidase
VHEPLPELGFVECRLLGLRDVVRSAGDAARMRRTLKQAGRALLRAERARRIGARSYPRRAADLARRLQAFVARAGDAMRAGHVAVELHDRLVALATQAIASIPDA